MLGLSLVAGWYLTGWLCERDGFADRAATRSCFYATAASAFIGARSLYVIANWKRFEHVSDVFKLTQGGLVAYGGFIGGFVGAWIYCRVKKLSLLRWADCAVPSLCTGLMITRIGCFMYGCDFGRPWDGPWSVRFPPGSPAFVAQRIGGLLPPDATASLAVHPTQFYESMNGAILLLLLWFVRKNRRRDGEMLVAFTMGYAVLRFLVEMLRADMQRGGVLGLSTSQLIAIGTFGAAAALWMSLRRQPESPSVTR